MTIKHFRILLFVILLSGLTALFVSMAQPSEPQARQIWLYSYARFGLAVIVLVLLGFVGGLFANSIGNKQLSQKILARVNTAYGNGNPLFTTRTILLVACIFLVELFLLSYIGIPAILRPFIVWLFISSTAVWVTLRIAYASRLRERGTVFQRIRLSWRGLQPIQRRTFRILAAIGLVYFLVFIPLNIGGGHADYSSNFSGIDEEVEYPSIIRALTPGDDFSSSVYRVLIDESIVYGHSFITISSASLAIPRLLFGKGFGEKEVLNLLLLRQLINVLPVVLSLFILTWIITRFKSIWQSVALFVFLLLIPGVVTYNIRFFHPDGLLLFFVILTFYFLQRDELRLGSNFYLAAFTCGMAAAIKLWGFFFFLAIAIYLVIALVKKVASAGKTVRSGAGFIVVMVLTIFISTPGLMIPSIAKFTINTLASEQTGRIEDNQSPDPEGVYEKGLTNWMKYFQMYFIRDYYFYFCFLSLGIAALIGARKQISGVLLAWCLVTAVYLIYFVAIKSYWYMLPLMIPLYSAPFLLPEAVRSQNNATHQSIFSKPLVFKGIWLVVSGMCLSQFVFNLVQISYMIW